MKKLLFLLFLCALQAMAQNHSVVSSLTVVDSASCANNATTSGSTLLLSPLAGNDASVVIQLSGTFSATAQFQGTGDGANWVSVNALPVSGTQTAVTSATAAGAWRVTASALQAVRVCLSVYASGAVQTSITSSVGPSANGLGSGGGGGSGTVTSVTIAGTANQVTASGTCTITTTGTCTLSQPNTVILGTDNSAAGTLQLANGSAAAHTIFASGATTSNTIAGFATVPTSGHLVDCTTASTTCTLTDSGVVAANVIVAGGRKWSCQTGLGDGLNAIPAGTYLQSMCFNDTGATVTISGLRCFVDGGSSSTMNASGNTLGALLTGAVTCTTAWAAGTQSANVAFTSGDWIKFTFVADGTAKQTTWEVQGTY